MGLEEAAVEAAKQWKFEPAKQKDSGIAVDVLYIVTVKFRLPRNGD